ncbi:MAG TPA: T9SS type A sorting domain-containing protein [Bacteroidia bacterium]|jgi:hypothetical protein|nr:T9SS type A sorting domain-containing protein [Bacteroidia bacterium]
MEKISIVMLFCLFLTFQGKTQTNWYGGACNGTYYCDVGAITPTAATQTVSNGSFCSVMGGGGHTNTFNTWSALFVKTSFVVGVAGSKYCFSLSTQGSGTQSGNEIEIIDHACQTSGSDNLIYDSFTNNGSVGSIANNCFTWTAGAADAGKTYYIQLSDGGSGGGQFFGNISSEIVYFSYAAGNCACTGGIILPIELTSFTAIPNKTRGILINWETSTETNNDHFDIERSGNGVDFTAIKTVSGAGTSVTEKYYSVVDNHPILGLSYYRLKQTDRNGKFAYSNITSVIDIPEKVWIGNVYPNPTEDKVSFNLYSPVACNGHVQILDITGRVVIDEQTLLNEGNQKINISLYSLSKGVYSLRISTDEPGSFSQITKIIKN